MTICAKCHGRGYAEVHMISFDTCDGQSGRTVRQRKCRECGGSGLTNYGTESHPCYVVPPPNPEPSVAGDWPIDATPYVE